MSYKKYLQSQGYSKSTMTHYQSHVINYVNWSEDQGIEIEHSTYTDHLAYIHHLKEQGLAQVSIQIKLVALKKYYDWLISKNQAETNPLQKIKLQGTKKKKLYDLLSKQELSQLYSSYPIPTTVADYKHEKQYQSSHLSAKRNKIILGLIVYQGLTTTELIQLKNQDLDLREGKLYVASTRRSNSRNLDLESVQMLDLMEYQLKIRTEIQSQKAEATDYLLLTQGNGEQARIKRSIQSTLATIKREHPKVKSHKQLRASVITHWIKNHDLRSVQYRSGHRFISSTEAYVINDLDSLTEDINKYHPL